MKKRLLLLRHAMHAAAGNQRFYGCTDVALAERGRLQAAAVSSLIEPYKPERCFCSPLRRCLETIQPASGLPVEIASDLREVDFGSWEGMTFDEIQQSDPATVQRWAEFDPEFAFPQGERLEDFQCRIRRAAAFLISAPEKTILAVTHAGVIRTLLCHFLGLHPRQYVLFHVDYCSLTILEIFGDKGVLTGLNHQCLLEKF